METISPRIARLFKLSLLLVLVVACATLMLNVDGLQNNLSAIRYLMIAAQSTVRSSDLPLAFPVHGRGDLLKARLALAEGQYNVVLASTLATARNGDRLAGALAGQAYLRAGSDDEALKLWEYTGDVDSLRRAGLDRQAANKPEQALVFLRAAYKVDDKEAALALSNVLQTQGRTAEAIDVLTKALSSYDDPQFRRTWLQALADLARQQQDWTEALAVLAEWEREYPGDIYPFVRRGWVFYERDGEYQAAAEQFKHAIKLAPGDGTGYLHMGLLLTREQEFANAEIYYAQATELNPSDMEWLYTRANNLWSGGELEQAMALYKEIVLRNPTHQGALQAIERLSRSD